MALLGYGVVVMAGLVGIASASRQEVRGPEGEMVGQVLEQVGIMVDQVVEMHLTGCHLVIISTTRHSHAFASILRRLSADEKPGVVVEAASEFITDQLARDNLFQELWGEDSVSCRGLILDLTASNSTAIGLRFMLSSGLHLRSQTRVVIVGRRSGVREVLLHHSLRNTLHALYLALHHHTFLTSSPHQLVKALDPVLVYRRCLYCNNGGADVQLVHQWSHNHRIDATNDLFLDNFQNMMGSELSIVTVPYFPYMDFEPCRNNPEGLVKLKDSLDVRILSTLVTKLNFTYKIHAEPLRSFGEDKNGKFTGMIGKLQQEETDLSTIVAPTSGRLRVVDFLRTYPSDPLALTSLKPAPLPAELSLVRPFEGELWVALLVSVGAWSVCLWLLQRAWQWVAGGRRVELTTALLYGWGALLNDPPRDPSVSVSGRLLVGWWLVFCLIITTGYNSSLVAHLTVEGTTRPLDTFEDLVQKPWKWAVDPWLYKGATLEYFAKHSSPVVKKIYNNMEMLEAKEALQKVKSGSFSLIDHKNYIQVLVASYYTDSKGYTPFYISDKGITVIAVFGWGVRRGAPFLSSFRQVLSRLEDAGIIDHWTQEVITRRVRENRESQSLDPPGIHDSAQGRTKVVLGLHHLQGAFYLLLLGAGIASLTLLGENLTICCSSPW
ncbi:probable glutamate receptor [Procambarus clarkii]|uniref:probable glutamate receptor n=1 Tax=Procambarus clarkii TaxID=6728 RepID=UPI00374466AB